MRMGKDKNNKPEPVRVLIVGQTPPPYGGQAIMIQKLLEGHYEHVQLFHVRMHFFRNMGEAGRFQLRKVIETFKVLFKIILARIRHKPHILYYPPAGPKIWPVLKDIIILTATRRMFPKIVFHFRAGGLGEYYHQSPSLLKFFLRLAYFRPDVAIHNSEFSNDGEIIKAKKVYVIPNGIEDVFSNFSNLKNSISEIPVILYVGALYESKGVFDLLKAVQILNDQGYRFCLKLIGQGATEVEDAVRGFIFRNGLNENVKLLGVKVGDEKWLEFATSDIFCFPTYFEAENTPVVILEAMMFGLPVVATKWRGIPAMVRDRENGFLVSIRAPHEIAEKLKILIENENLRREMGRRGREIFLREFTIDKFRKKMEEVFLETAKDIVQ